MFSVENLTFQSNRKSTENVDLKISKNQDFSMLVRVFNKFNSPYYFNYCKIIYMYSRPREERKSVK